MAYHQSSLTPTRPAPQAPQRLADDKSSYSGSSLASSGYFSIIPSSPSSSSYASSYSGIGGSPHRHSEQVVRKGMVNIKEDGFASWLWGRKWLVLKEETLAIHKTEVSSLRLG